MKARKVPESGIVSRKVSGTGFQQPQRLVYPYTKASLVNDERGLPFLFSGAPIGVASLTLPRR
jgi:hypothetical protein